MEKKTSRIITQTLLQKTLKDICDSSKQSMRNIVDLALQFSTTKSQYVFLSNIQKVLENEKISYYELIQDIASHINNDKIITFGMNIGYSLCKDSNNRVQKIILNNHFRIPFSLFKKYPDSAFIIYCKTSHLTTRLLENISEFNNIMFVLYYDDDVLEGCKLLRERGMLYSVCYTYTNDNFTFITNDELLYSIQQLYPIFTIFEADECCKEETKKEIYTYTNNVRRNNSFNTIPLEKKCDTIYIRNLIHNTSLAAKERDYIGLSI